MLDKRFAKRQIHPFGVYYWDTFDNETWMVTQSPDIRLAEEYVKNNYIISPEGADIVEIVSLNGDIVESYKTSGGKYQ